MKIGGIERRARELEMACSLDSMSVEGSVRDAVIGFFSNQRLSQSETLKFREELGKIKPGSRKNAS
jgi:hypothetical protein